MSKISLNDFHLSDAQLGIIYELLGSTDHVYIVGGAIRDLYLGLPCHDIDLAVDLRPQDLFCIFGKKAKLTGNRFPTVRVKHQGVEIEISTFRKELNKGTGRKACELEFSDSVHDDLARRDLTVNALAFEVLTDCVVDDHSGWSDLSARVIRFVGAPLERIAEDPTRILRASRFRARIGGTFDSDTLLAIQSEAAHKLFLDVVPKEQIRAEIMKWLESRTPLSNFFEDLHTFGLLGDLFPELEKAYDLDGGVHHAETVFKHNMLVGDAFEISDLSDVQEQLARFSTYLHDYGKVATYDPEAGTFLTHHHVGAKLVRELLLDFRFSLDETDFITKLVENHMRRPTTLKGVRRLLCDFPDDLEFLLKLFRADSVGNLNTETAQRRVDRFERFLQQIETVKNEPTSFSVLDIDGTDLLTEFNLKPGRKIGELLKIARELVLENPELNSRDLLLSHLRDHL